jgi:hypothetical protein
MSGGMIVEDVSGKADLVMTTEGDMIDYVTASGGRTRLPIGSTGETLQVSGAGLPEWASSAGLTETTGLSASNYASVYSGSSQAIGVNAFQVGDSIDARMPAGQKFLQCVALECKIGSVATGNFRLSLWCRSAVRGYMSLLAWCPQASATSFGTDTIAKIATVGSSIIPNVITNEDFMISIISDNAAFTCYTLGGTGVGWGVAYGANTPTTTDHDIANSWQQPELKAYFTGYS